MIAHALRHPGARFTIPSHRREQGVVYQTARTDLLGLAEAGALIQEKIGKSFHFRVPADLERRLKDL